jgi:drug/metabolite transporter (DMT)-like permease
MNPAAVVSADSASREPRWVLDFIVLAAIWGSSFLFMHLGAVEFGAFPTAAVRVAIAALFLLPFVWLRGLLPVLKQHWRKTFFVGILNAGIPFACYAYALLSISTGLSSILNATVPMFGALVAWVWLKDKPAPTRILGLVVGFVGVAMLASRATQPGELFTVNAAGASPGWAVMACLLACVCYALAASYTRRYLAGIPSLVTATGSLLGATLGLALPAAWLWPTQAPSGIAWLAMLAAGVLCTGVAYVVFFRLIANAGPPRALSVTFLVPVFAVLYGVLFLGEAVTLWMLLCALVIVGGTALSSDLLKLSRWMPASRRASATEAPPPPH